MKALNVSEQVVSGWAMRGVPETHQRRSAGVTCVQCPVSSVPLHRITHTREEGHRIIGSSHHRTQLNNLTFQRHVIAVISVNLTCLLMDVFSTFPRKYHNILPNMINTPAHAPLGGSSSHQPNQMEPYGWEFWQLVFPSPCPLLWWAQT